MEATGDTFPGSGISPIQDKIRPPATAKAHLPLPRQKTNLKIKPRKTIPRYNILWYNYHIISRSARTFSSLVAQLVTNLTAILSSSTGHQSSKRTFE